jgi:RimJ/RimL family protein N-acetyltransferase
MRYLESERLLLRPPEPRDVAAITTWIGDFEVAKNLATVPHPYREADARAHVAQAIEARAKGEGFVFVVTRRQDEMVLGHCGLRLKDGAWRLGYWLGRPFWGQGYASEAAALVLRYAFDVLRADRVGAGWFHDNPASGRILEKLGFSYDGAAPQASLARGHEVYCHQAKLTAEDFRRRKPFEAPRVMLRCERSEPRSTRAGHLRATAK